MSYLLDCFKLITPIFCLSCISYYVQYVSELNNAQTYPYFHHKRPEDIQKLSDGESESALYHEFVPISRSSNSFSLELGYIITDNVYVMNSIGGRIRFRRLLCLFLVIFLIINTTTPAAAGGINTPTSMILSRGVRVSPPHFCHAPYDCRVSP